MKPNQLATLVLRLLGIFCLIQFIPAIAITSSAAPIIRAPDSFGSSVIVAETFVFLFLALQLAVGILLIAKSVPWGEKLMPQKTDEAPLISTSLEQIQALAFGVAGVIIFSETLPQLANSFVSILTLLAPTAKGAGYPIDNFFIWRSFFIAMGTLAKAALGLWLFFGAHGFTKFWRTARNFGTPKPPQ